MQGNSERFVTSSSMRADRALPNFFHVYSIHAFYNDHNKRRRRFFFGRTYIPKQYNATLNRCARRGGGGQVL